MMDDIEMMATNQLLPVFNGGNGGGQQPQDVLRFGNSLVQSNYLQSGAQQTILSSKAQPCNMTGNALKQQLVQQQQQQPIVRFENGDPQMVNVQPPGINITNLFCQDNLFDWVKILTRGLILKSTLGQSCKRSTIVIYSSRVVMICSIHDSIRI